MKLQHVILTRFNLATPGREEAIRNHPDWLASRFELFERYCLPTVAAQTVKDFRWIIFFDENTPQEFRDRIEALRKVQDFHPYYTGLFPATGWVKAIHEVLGPQSDITHLLTTRLDNDDGLAVDFVERLHAKALTCNEQDGSIALNFTSGFVLFKNCLYEHIHESNAFASLLEPYNDDMRTITTIPHMDLSNQVTLKQVDAPGIWLQVIHGNNVSNKVRGLRVSAKAAEGRFPAVVSEDFHETNATLAFFENMTVGLARTFRDTLLDRWRAIKGVKPV